MEFDRAVEERRSIRAFKSRKISKDNIKKILEAGRLSPSAKNRQPWHFVVLTGEQKDHVADLMIDWYDNNDIGAREAREVTIAGLKYTVSSRGWTSVKETARVIKESAVYVLVFRESDIEWLNSDTLSIGACTQSMILKATDLGIGSLWIADVKCVQKETADYLKVPSELELSTSVAFGYNNEFPAPRPRKKLDELCIKV